MKLNQIKFNPPNAAFDKAIRDGRLSRNHRLANYAGDYMYMGTVDGIDTFKNIDTRSYLA